MSAARERASKPTFSFRNIDGSGKLRELILYVSSACQTDPTFGRVKLNKILYHADFNAYRETGTPVTGVKYQRLPHGPAPVMMKPVLDEMTRDGEISSPHVEEYEFRRIVPLREPDFNKLEARDVAFVDREIRRLWGVTARDVSMDSHTRPWRIAGDRKPIPYEAALLSDEGVTEDDLLRSLQLAQAYAWCNV